MVLQNEVFDNIRMKMELAMILKWLLIELFCLTKN